MRVTTGGIDCMAPVGATMSGRVPPTTTMVDFQCPPDCVRSNRYFTGGPSLLADGWAASRRPRRIASSALKVFQVSRGPVPLTARTYASDAGTASASAVAHTIAMGLPFAFDI